MPLAVEIASSSALSSIIDDPSTAAQRASAASVLDSHALDHFDHYIAHPDILEVHDSSPRTPPALMTPQGLPSDPKQAVWAMATAATAAAKDATNSKKKQIPHKRPIAPSTIVQPTPSTLSTFPANTNFNHIHIVQPYIHNSNGAGNENNKTKEGDGTAPANANGCSTSTFSINTSTSYTFTNPFCTNTLHSTLPSVGGGSAPSGQPPRPANAWILYRSHKMKDLTPTEPGAPRRPQADISKLIAEMWKNETPEVRQRYEQLSDMKKAEHLALYPGYRFQPMKKADRDKARADRKAEKERERLANMPVKSYRKPPKSKRGVTAESEDSTPVPPSATTTTVTSPISPSVVNWTESVLAAQPSDAGVTSPTARQHAFSYQPYAIPSPGISSVPASSSTSSAVSKRKRVRTKVEVSTPALPSEEPVSQPDYTTSSGSRYYQQQQQPAEGAPLFDFAAYNAEQGFTQAYNPSMSHLSNGATSDPNSHPTSSYNALDSNLIHHQSVPASNTYSIEPIGGEYNIFQFTDFDTSLLNNPGAEIAFSLPEDIELEFLDGVALGLGEDGLAFDGMGGLGEFSSLASTGNGTEAPMPSSNMLGFTNTQPNVLQGDPTVQTMPQPQQQQLMTSIQTAHYPTGPVLSPTVADPYAAVSPTDMEQVPISFYGTFPIHQASYPPSYSHQPQPQPHHHHHHHHHHHGFSQDLSSPVQQTFGHPSHGYIASSHPASYTSPGQPFLSPTYTSPPSMSIMDDASMSPVNEQSMAPHGMGGMRRLAPKPQ